MRRLIIITAVAALLAQAPASAVEVDRDAGGGTIRVTDSRPADQTRRRPAPQEAQEWFPYTVVRWLGGEGFCVDTLWTRDEGLARLYGQVRPTIGWVQRQCPPDAAVEVPDPATIAAATWQDVKSLPVPSLDIDPDHALAGKKVYLEIAGAQTWTETIDNPIGDDIVLTATSDYLVGWGDPRRPEPTVTRSPGGPWPDGDVTHTYSDAAPKRTITVTQRWRATWSAGGQGGTLDRLATTSAPLSLEVRQLEAVRNR